ncbi:hypothetical protein EP331_12705 [bacterium]|nr:MAG: hypothetical protein EP331_12705 [bacterium]
MGKLLLRSFILGFLLSSGSISTAVAQSKTDKVEDKISGSKSGDSDSSTEDDDDGWGWIFEIFFENLPALLYFEKFDASEYSAYYNPYPFYPTSYNNTGLRSYDSNKLYSLQLDFDHSYYLFDQVDQNFSLAAKWRIDYWGLDVDYRQWNEQYATKSLHQFHAAIERKMRYFPRSEAAIQIGYQAFEVNGKRSNGMYFGFTSDYYWIKPVSLHFDYAGMLVGNDTSTELFPTSTMKTGFKYHYKHAGFGVFYERLNFDGIVFQSFNLGYSVYF